MQETTSNGVSNFGAAGDVGVTIFVGVEALDDLGIGTLNGFAGVSTGEADLELVRSTDTVRSPSLLVRSTDTVRSRVGGSALEPERSGASLNVATLSA